MNVLAVFAHPDDEVLGCGGTLAKHAENGDDVVVNILAVRDLLSPLCAATKTLGVRLTWHHNPDQAFETLLLSQLVAQVPPTNDPDVIYTHHPGDLNLDHSLTARAVLTAFRPKPGEKPRTILACEVLSSTEWTFPPQFQPNWFEELTHGQLCKKIKALGCYPSEEQSSPHPRSRVGIGNVARVRGNQCGVPYAEAFQLLRRGPC